MMAIDNYGEGGERERERERERCGRRRESTYILFPVSYPCFEIDENSNSYPNSIKTEKTR